LNKLSVNCVLSYSDFLNFPYVQRLENRKKKMKRSNLISVFCVTLALLSATVACNWSTANLSSFATSKDKDGKQAATSFKAGDTIFATAQVSNNSGKVKVNLSVVAEDAKGLKKGETLKGSEVSLDVDGDKSANYNLPLPESFPGGKFKVVADMINESGEKKDSKSVDITVEGGKPAESAPADEDKDSDS
jgi:hypothetical protein